MSFTFPFFCFLRNKSNILSVFFVVGVLFLSACSFGQEAKLTLLNFRVTPQDGKISIISGSTIPVTISFFVPHSLKSVYYVNITFTNQSIETGPIFNEDFNVSGELIVKPVYGNVVTLELNCKQISNGSFVCYNLTLHNLTLSGIPPSENLINLRVTSHPGLIPGEYSFNVSIVVVREIGVNFSYSKIYGFVPANQTTFLISTSPELNVSIYSNESFNVSIEAIHYLDTFLPKPKSVLLRMFEFLLDEDQEKKINEAKIVVSLPPDLIRRIDRDSVDVYRWNGSNWVLLSRYNWRWIDDNRIEITTNKFSIWGIFGEYPAPSPTPAYGAEITIPTQAPKLSIKLTLPISLVQRVNSSQTYGFRVENDGEINLEKVYFEIEGLDREWYWLPPQTVLRVNESKDLYFVLSIPETDEKEIVFNFTVIAEGYGRKVSEKRQVSLKLIKEVPIQPVIAVCGNNVCEPGENETCPQDCRPILQNITAPLSPAQIITGAVVMIAENKNIRYVGIFVIVAILSLFTIKKYNESKKPWKVYEKEKVVSDVLRKLKNQIKKYVEEE